MIDLSPAPKKAVIYSLNGKYTLESEAGVQDGTVFIPLLNASVSVGIESTRIGNYVLLTCPNNGGKATLEIGSETFECNGVLLNLPAKVFAQGDEVFAHPALFTQMMTGLSFEATQKANGTWQAVLTLKKDASPAFLIAPATLPETAPNTQPATTAPETVPPTAEVHAPDLSDPLLVLVNKSNPLGADYAPTNMRNTAHTYYKMVEPAADALEAMLDAAEEAGHGDLMLVSAYRTYSKQSQLYEAKIEAYRPKYGDDAPAMAATIVAIPGTSEHQTGLAADLSLDGSLNDSFADTAAGKWLAAHCHEYGYILRYLPNKSDLTGIVSEPWHFRYVGVESATYIMENGICFEEYWDLFGKNQ